MLRTISLLSTHGSENSKPHKTIQCKLFIIEYKELIKSE